ncbi:SpoIIE family protein phosphatase [Pelagicoccus mobilis]|uniref:SpoIIE family protein phosphatase n=1 Tax=Pelagicoccus mobilis TaxID=415221 RepID=A0A934VQ29_9BACT|nr:SpoIIE family protein phosphatase [Pelagicoccus mobilis]MBK1876455.1 SpoIIE family protein phosphatase [Pelagicoccus mobilis]
MKVLKVNCNARVSDWLSRTHPELEEESVESDLPISGCYEQVDLVIVGSTSTSLLDLAKAISDWPSAPPTIFTLESSNATSFADRLSFEPGIGRNIFSCELEEGDFARALNEALNICEKRKQLNLQSDQQLVSINPNMSPGWLFKLMLKDLPEYIYFKDAAGRFLASSEYMAKGSGLSDTSQAIGLTDYDLFDKEHADEAAIDEAKLVNGELQKVEKEEFVTWEGNEIWVHSLKLPMVSQSGHPLGTFGISRDITERKRLAQQLEEQHKILEEELTLARSLQQSLLTKGIPQFQDEDGNAQLTFAAKHIPSTQLSGDFYSVIKTPSGNAAIFLADVMGHGASAAMVTAMLYAAVNEINHLADSPRSFMQEINNMLFSWLGEKGHIIFASGVFCLINLKEKSGEICVNGGTHALLPQEPESPIPVNPALGLIPGVEFESHRFPIQTGEQIVFFTDGVLEAMSPEGEEFGAEGIARSIAKSESKSPEEKLDTLIHDVRRFTGKDQEGDDVCLLMAQLA